MFDLLADLAVDHERHVVVVRGGLVLLLCAGAVAGLHPGQTESSPPLSRFLLPGHGSRYRGVVGGRFGSGTRTHHVASKARHVWAAECGLQGWTLSPSALVMGGSQLFVALSTTDKPAILTDILPATSYKIKAFRSRGFTITAKKLFFS